MSVSNKNSSFLTSHQAYKKYCLITIFIIILLISRKKTIGNLMKSYAQIMQSEAGNNFMESI